MNSDTSPVFFKRKGYLEVPFFLAPLIILSCLFLSSCSSTSTSATTSPSQQNSQGSSASIAVTNPLATSDSVPIENSGLTSIGNIVEQDQGGDTAFSLTWKMGAVQYTPPPSDVLDACNFNYQDVISRSVFFPAEVDVKYSTGTLMSGIQLFAWQTVQQASAPTAFLGPLDWFGSQAFQINGTWQCLPNASTMTPPQLNFQPGEEIKIPVWFMKDNIINNASPKVNQATLDNWMLSKSFSGLPVLEVSGPNMAVCSDKVRVLFLFTKNGKC